MSAVITHPGHAAGTRRKLPYPIGHQFHADLLCYRRNIQSVFFTILMPSPGPSPRRSGNPSDPPTPAENPPKSYPYMG